MTREQHFRRTVQLIDSSPKLILPLAFYRACEAIILVTEAALGSAHRMTDDERAGAIYDTAEYLLLGAAEYGQQVLAAARAAQEAIQAAKEPK